MAELAIKSDTSEEVVGTLKPVDKDQKEAILDGPVMVTVESGSGDFKQDSAKPLDVVYRSGAVEGVTIYTVTGRSLNGPPVTDRVTYTVSKVPAPALADLGQTFGAPEPKV